MNKRNFKKIFIIIVPLVFLFIIYIFFNNKESKNFKIGNNSTNQEIIDYILNISSYETTVDLEIFSNKNNNKYKIKQKYIKPNILEQEIMEPSNLEGLKIINEQDGLKIENSRLKLSKIYNNYKFMTNNCIDLKNFIEKYKNSNKSRYEENNKEIIMILEDDKDNKYHSEKILYVDKDTKKPTKMEIKDISKKTTIYIQYNEVKLNKAK